MGPKAKSEPNARKSKNSTQQQSKATTNSKKIKKSASSPAKRPPRKSSRKSSPEVPLASSSPSSHQSSSAKHILCIEKNSYQTNPFVKLIDRSKPVKVVPLEYDSLPHYSHQEMDYCNNYNYKCDGKPYSLTQSSGLKLKIKQLPVNSVENKMKSSKIKKKMDNKPIEAKTKQPKKNYKRFSNNVTVLTPPLSPENSDIDVIACSDSDEIVAAHKARSTLDDALERNEPIIKPIELYDSKNVWLGKAADQNTSKDFSLLFGFVRTFPEPDESQLQLLLNEMNDAPLPILCPMEVSDFFSQIENI